MKNKNNGILFYSLVAFVAIVLSSWILTESSYKKKENKILQEQIDSLVNVAKVYHGDDTIRVLSKHLPKNTINAPITRLKNIIIIHSLVVLTVVLFFFIFIRGKMRIDSSNGAKKGALFEESDEDKQN